jgi:hypothetical protein
LERWKAISAKAAAGLDRDGKDLTKYRPDRQSKPDQASKTSSFSTE